MARRAPALLALAVLLASSAAQSYPPGWGCPTGEHGAPGPCPSHDGELLCGAIAGGVVGITLLTSVLLLLLPARGPTAETIGRRELHLALSGLLWVLLVALFVHGEAGRSIAVPLTVLTFVVVGVGLAIAATSPARRAAAKLSNARENVDLLVGEARADGSGWRLDLGGDDARALSIAGAARMGFPARGSIAGPCVVVAAPAESLGASYRANAPPAIEASLVVRAGSRAEALRVARLLCLNVYASLLGALWMLTLSGIAWAAAR